MVHGLLVAVVGGWMMAQQSGLVTQTELPPPGASQSRPAPSAAVPAPAAPTPAPRVSSETVPAKEPGKDSDGSRRKTPEAAKEKKEPLPSSEGTKPSSGKRVAAFWVVLPGK